MNLQRLITMTNEIAAFFAADPDSEQGMREMASHLKRFWTPEMRAQILAYHQENGAGLQEFSRKALSRLAAETAK